MVPVIMGPYHGLDIFSCYSIIFKNLSHILLHLDAPTTFLDSLDDIRSRFFPILANAEIENESTVAGWMVDEEGISRTCDRFEVCDLRLHH